MSSFKINAKHKATGEIHEILCLDDFFGKHQYAYCPNVEGGEYMTEEKFYKQYEPVEQKQ